MLEQPDGKESEETTQREGCPLVSRVLTSRCTTKSSAQCVRAKAHQSLTRGMGEVFHVEMEVFHCLLTRKRPPRGHTGAGFLRRPNYKLRSRMPVSRE